jgi:APA family basic amino acid/polyamine antiporter
MSLRSLFKTKSLDGILEDAERPEYRLRRALGPLQLTLLGIGAIIGAGIFATIGTAAAGDAYRPGAGPALVVSFLVTAVVCAFTALCYAELASMVPISGSAYTYSYATLGELVAWIIGWDLIIEYAVGNIAVAISWANYFKTLVRGFGIVIPDWASMDYRTAARIVDASGASTVFRDAPKLFGVPLVFNFLALSIVILITAVLVWGIRESARFNAIMVGIKILVLTFFIVVGCYWIRPENWTPFAPNGWAGISAGAAIVFFAYIGFDAVSTVAEETREPQRSLPVGILASLVVCTVFYVVVAAVFTGLISYADLGSALATEQAEPLTLALERAAPNLGWAVGIVALGSVIAHTAVLLVFQLGQPRIFFSMARDGLLPPFIARVHPRFRTPHVATIATGIFVGIFAAVASLDEMVDLTNIGTLFAFILVCAGVIVLRVKEPQRPRPFRVPGGHIVPVLGIVSCLYLIYYLPPTSWLRFAAWLNFGFVIYVAYGSVHSRLTGRRSSADPADHAATTALEGTVLAWAGTALLILTRAFDMWRGAPDGASFLATVSARSAWLEPSAFLLVPVALNAYLLCPVAIRRALKARSVAAVVPAALLIAISTVYFLLVIAT